MRIKHSPLGSLNFTFLFKASRNFKESSRVIHGSEVSGGIPWMVQLLNNDNVHMCGGVLLSDRNILSAAHCLDGFGYYVVIGVISRRTASNLQETDSLKQRISRPLALHPMHEYFKDNEMSITIYDFMLLILQTPLKNYCPQNFARLPSLDFANEHFLANKALILNGWGSTRALTREDIIKYNKGELDLVKSLSFPSNLRQISLSYVPNHVCQKRFQYFFFDHHETIGRKPLSHKYTVNSIGLIKFGSGLGLSMICTSICPEENLNQCLHQHESQSACFGDSGCKLLPEIHITNVLISYIYVNYLVLFIFLL